MEALQPKYTNQLIHETSPYLLQHAHNPINWLAWNEDTLAKARKENKLILISIGYSACHWCHVMEHECFEDEQVAQLMNDYFICIKIDREERPDIDQIYMLAVQLMTGRGGWPLNCFALPDGRPIYGGTYFPKQQWINILFNLADTFVNDREKVLDYAERLTNGVKQAEIIKPAKEETKLTSNLLNQSYNNWKERFDYEEGGPNKAPKFPLPNNYQFLLRYAQPSSTIPIEERTALLQHLELTLTKMAYGGIYDQVGGGFSRYSVDDLWKVPHFEKMLYDNAQLVSLYSEAFQATKNPLYKQIVYETLAFVERELTSPEGGFYSALDADSEGVEGKYYVWQQEELKTILKEDYLLVADYFNINKRGLWEHDNYILLRHDTDKTIANKHNISLKELENKINEIKKRLLFVREKRIHPGLDNKIITSWNALMTKAYVDAYNVFDEKHFLEKAIKNVDYLLKYALKDNVVLSHLAPTITNEKNANKFHGFLEDYCFTIEALISIYESTFKESHLHKANELMVYCINHFMDTNNGMFYFTSDTDKALISRKMELSDNVVPASNSSIAKSLFKLSHHFEKEEYLQMSKRMLNYVIDEMIGYGEGYSNWAILFLNLVQPFYEVAIVGKSVEEKRKELFKHFIPNAIFAGCREESSLPLLKNRWVENETLIYVCENKTCNKPVSESREVMSSLRSA